jgi:hypothetical protein
MVLAAGPAPRTSVSELLIILEAACEASARVLLLEGSVTDQELSRMVSLEGIAQRYADEASALRATLAACNEVAAKYKSELDRFREREPLVQSLVRVTLEHEYEYCGPDMSPTAEAVRDFSLSASEAAAS